VHKEKCATLAVAQEKGDKLRKAKYTKIQTHTRKVSQRYMLTATITSYETVT